MEVEKSRLSAEVGGLNAARVDLESVRKEVGSMKKEVEGVKATEALAAERALKAIETADNLRKEINSERESSTALKAQVDLLSMCLDATKEIGLAAAKMYTDTLEHFGGSTSSLPSEPSPFNLFTWLS
jgi:uncharacterized protein YlxW (UPF0749 family)